MPQDGSQNYYYPPGTRGITDETIESAAYNNFLDDLVEHDLNIPRPIHRGGTGAITADKALINLGAEKAAQVVTNYDSHVWLPGSFRSAAGATASPVADHAFAGIVYLGEPYLDPPTNANVVVSARDLDDTVVPSRVYVREKKANVWGAWTVIDATTLPLPPGVPGLDATTILAAIQELAVEKADITYVDAEITELKTYVDLEDVDLQNQITALDTDKADVTYVNSITTLSYDGLAYLGLQTNGSFIVNQARPVGISNTIVGAAVLTDGWNVLHGTVSNSTIDYSSMGMNVYTHRPYNTPPVLAAGDAICVSQSIEGYRFARVGWGNDAPAIFAQYPITISFLARHTRAGTYCVAVRHPALTASYIATYTQDVDDVEQYYALTIPATTNLIWERGVNPAVQIIFTIAAGSNYIGTANAWNSGNKLTVAGAINAAQTISDRFRIRGVMVNMGTVAPTADRLPYLLRPYEQELALCQRYYQGYNSTFAGAIIATGIAYSATTAYFSMRLSPTMRVAPSWTDPQAPANFSVHAANGVISGATAFSTANSTPDVARFELTTTGLVAGQAVMLQSAAFPVAIGLSARM